MKLENQVIDLYDDVDLEANLVKMASAMPPEMRKMELPTIEDRDTKPDHAFALQLVTKTASRLRKYPVDTPLEAYFSDGYFAKNAHKLPLGAQKVAAAGILRACRRFGLTPSQPVEKLAEGVNAKSNVFIEPSFDYDGELLKKASAEIPHTAAFAESPYFYGLVKSGECRYGMPTPALVKEAAAYFDKYAKEFTPEDRVQFARNVSGRAAELGVEIHSPAVEKYAGKAYSADVDGHIALRQSLLHDGPIKVAYSKLLEKKSSADPDTFANTMHELDKRAGLTKYYDSKIADPYYATFGSEKRADAIVDLVKSKRPELESYFGKSMVDSLEKEGTAAYEALPNDAKDIIRAVSNGTAE